MKMKMKKRSSALFTFNMKMKSMRSNTNKGCHKKGGRQQDIIHMPGTLEGLLQELEVEKFNNIVLIKTQVIYMFTCCTRCKFQVEKS